MSIAMLERAAKGRPRSSRGGHLSVARPLPKLRITDQGAPSPRVTKDVDLVVEVASRAGWYRFEERLRRASQRF